MKFWRIKWELVLVLFALVTVIAGIQLYNYTQDLRVYVMTLVATVILALFVISYKTIKNIRHEMINNWK